MKHSSIIVGAIIGAACITAAIAQIKNPGSNGLPFVNPWTFNSTTGSGLFGMGSGVKLAIVAPNSGAASLQSISGCGTSPSLLASTDTMGRFTTGTGTVNSCTISFSSPYTTPPRCFLQQQTGTIEPEEVSTVVGSFTVTFAASAPSTQWIWLCASPSSTE